MSFIYEEKESSSPYLDVVWHTEDQTDGVYIASADACWDMIFIQSKEGESKVLLSGPSSKTTRVPYSAGNKNFGIRFHPGVIFVNIPLTEMIDVTKALPMPTEDRFVLQGITWKVPTYETIDEFLIRLEEGDSFNFREVLNLFRGDDMNIKPFHIKISQAQYRRFPLP